MSHYKVTLHKIPTSFNGFKILQISDLHSKSFGKDNYRLINKISSENPDIIVITRDTINTKDTDFKVFINLAKQVSKSYDTYYIVGNHEQNLSGNKLKALIDNRKVSQW